MLLMRLLTLVVGGLVMLSLMPVVICLGFVDVGILSFLTFIGSYVMAVMVLLLILWFGLLVPSPRGVGWFMRFGTGHCCTGHLVFGNVNGLMCMHPLSVLMILLSGPTLPVSWLNGWPFFLPCIGLLVVWILGWWCVLC